VTSRLPTPPEPTPVPPPERWASLGGVSLGGPSAVLQTGGRLVAFVRGTDNRIYHRWQTTSNGDWADWEAVPGECHHVLQRSARTSGASYGRRNTSSRQPVPPKIFAMPRLGWCSASNQGNAYPIRIRIYGRCRVCRERDRSVLVSPGSVLTSTGCRRADRSELIGGR
jgi:hypothetical protein